MNHSEAVEQMTSERYLLNELTPDARDAFEEHVIRLPGMRPRLTRRRSLCA